MTRKWITVEEAKTAIVEVKAYVKQNSDGFKELHEKYRNYYAGMFAQVGAKNPLSALDPDNLMIEIGAVMFAGAMLANKYGWLREDAASTPFSTTPPTPEYTGIEGQKVTIEPEPGYGFTLHCNKELIARIHFGTNNNLYIYPRASNSVPAVDIYRDGNKITDIRVEGQKVWVATDSKKPA